MERPQRNYWEGYYKKEWYFLKNLWNQIYIPEHRWIMQQYLWRELLFSEAVHHKNWIKWDNRLENLVLLSHSEHTHLHAEQWDHNHKERPVIICQKCGQELPLYAKWLCRNCYMAKAQKIYVSNNTEKTRETKRKCRLKTKDKIAEYKKTRYKHFRNLGYSAKQASSM